MNAVANRKPLAERVTLMSFYYWPADLTLTLEQGFDEQENSRGYLVRVNSNRGNDGSPLGSCELSFDDYAQARAAFASKVGVLM